MKISPIAIPIKDILKNFKEDDEGKITGWDGRLDVRPSYQREYIHDRNSKRNKFRVGLMESIYHNFPINSIYFAEKGNGEYELLDGQQRIITIWDYSKGDFSILNTPTSAVYVHHFEESFNNYELQVYLCRGNTNDKLKWFETINTGSHKLSDQELKNALHNGPWVSDAKRYFTKNTNPKGSGRGKSGKELCDLWLCGSRNRQEHLECILKWKCHENHNDKQSTNIVAFMAKHQNRESAKHLWDYFLEVTEWASGYFPSEEGNISKDYVKHLKNINWGRLYSEYNHKAKRYSSEEIKSKFIEIIDKNDIDKPTGLYEFLLSGSNDYNLIRNRYFDNKTKRKVWMKQCKKCNNCKNNIPLKSSHGDHKHPFHLGGLTNEENCQILCPRCNLSKSYKT